MRLWLFRHARMMVYVDEYFKDDGVGERLEIKRVFAEALIQSVHPLVIWLEVVSAWG